MQNTSYPHGEGYGSPYPPYSPRKPLSTKKIVLLVSAILLGFFLLLSLMIGGIILFVNSLLKNAMKTEEYQIAYTYLITNAEGLTANGEGADIRLNAYSTSYSSGNSHSQSKKEFGFLVNGRSYTVVLHEEEDGWAVCRECTDGE